MGTDRRARDGSSWRIVESKKTGKRDRHGELTSPMGQAKGPVRAVTRTGEGKKNTMTRKRCCKTGARHREKQYEISRIDSGRKRRRSSLQGHEASAIPRGGAGGHTIFRRGWHKRRRQQERHKSRSEMPSQRWTRCPPEGYGTAAPIGQQKSRLAAGRKSRGAVGSWEKDRWGVQG